MIIRDDQIRHFVLLGCGLERLSALSAVMTRQPHLRKIPLMPSSTSGSSSITRTSLSLARLGWARGTIDASMARLLAGRAGQ